MNSGSPATSATSLSSSSYSLESAAALLDRAVQSGQISSAVFVAHLGTHSIEQAFGNAKLESSFLLGSISKPICIAALMSLYDEGLFQLDDPVHRYLPEFQGDRREQVTIRHLLSHVSGLPDQLPNNAELRKNHASLAAFTHAAYKLPLSFAPGSAYQYSSMGILLATEIAQRLADCSIASLVERTIIQPLGMTHTALGMGNLPIDATVPVQTEHAAPESGGGDPSAKLWDWNSRYWRGLGAPWGGVQASAKDVAKFLLAFVQEKEDFLSPTTRNLMIQNHNRKEIVARGLGFAVGSSVHHQCTSDAFGHTGSTGTIALHDAQHSLTCVILTSLPGEAMKPHPREQALDCLYR